MSKISDDFDTLFKEFSVAHSWYKHLIGNVLFCPVPTEDGKWTFITEWDINHFVENKNEKWYKDHPLSNKTVRDACLLNSFPVNSFVYSGGHGLIHTLGQNGYAIFTLLDNLGHNKESEYIRAFCIDNSKADDSRYKIRYNGPDQTKDLIISGLYTKEYERIKKLAKEAYDKTVKALSGITF